MKQQRGSIFRTAIDQVRAGSNNPFNERSSIIASLIIALSGLILYLDKALVDVDITPFMPAKFLEKGVDPDFFIWLVCITISPILIIIGSIMRPYFYSYIVPLYCYILQFYFILFDYSLVDDGYGHTYSIGISILLMVIMFFSRKASQRGTRLLIDQMKEKARKAKVEHARD